jgi:hypothetical protein
MRNYFQVTRKHSYSLLFALPLLLAYEAGAAMIADADSGMRNGADVLLRTVLAATGVHGTMAFTAILLAVGTVLVALERRRERVPLRGEVFAGMLGESVVYALAFGFVVSLLTQWVLGGFVRLAQDPVPMGQVGFFDSLVLSLGAGIYEELLFRVILVGGLMWLFASLGLKRNHGAVAAAVLAAFLFSAFHYIGPYAYPLELASFTFRFLAGLTLNALFILRGFGITAWTHALYDVFVLLLHGSFN